VALATLPGRSILQQSAAAEPAAPLEPEHLELKQA
jgi:hypothetical protein